MTHRRVSLVLLLLWSLSGCSGQPERAHAAAPSFEPGARVPDEPLILQDGFELRLPAMKGKLIAVFFCASLDDPECQREAQVLAEHHAELHDDHHVVVIGVSPATTAVHKTWLAAQHSPLDFAADPDGRVARAFRVGEGPAVVVVDKDSSIRAVWRDADPERHVRELLAAAR